MATVPELLDTIERALAGVKEAVASLGEGEMFATQMAFTVTVLANAVAEARSGINPRQVRDLDFALNDLVAFSNELSAEGVDLVSRPLAVLQESIGALKSQVVIPQSTIASARALQQKLRERKTAIQKLTYLPPGTVAPPLPHEPSTLVAEASSVRDAFAQAGFETPLLDDFIAAPSEARMQHLADLAEEIETVIG
ncbi:MAG: hypothetical protein ACYC7A_03685 [Thermoanaerobaculia bacterium]